MKKVCMTSSPLPQSDALNHQETYRILVVDDDKDVLQIYERVLNGGPEEIQPNTELAALESDLFGDENQTISPGSGTEKQGSNNCDPIDQADQEPPSNIYDLILCTQGDEAIEAVRRAKQESRPVAIGFIDVRLPPGIDGVRTAEKIREVDPDIQLVIVTGFSDRNPSEIAQRVKPIERLLYIQKPLHAQELRHFVSALSAKWLSERALKETQTRLANILDSVQAGIVTIDAGRHVIVDANPYAVNIIGAPREEIIGSSCHRYICHDQGGVCPVAELEQGGSISEEGKLMSRNSGEIPILKTVTRTTLHGQEHLVESFIDISERRKLQLQVQQAQKMEAIGTLAGGIAHDFNNILAAIVGYIELASMENLVSVDAKSNLYKALEATKRAKGLVNQILTFSRQREDELKPLDLGAIAREVLELIRATIPTTIEIRREITTQQAVVIANPTQIQQLIMNLCVNAAHAMRETGGVLSMTVTKTDTADDEILRQHTHLKPGPYVKLAISDQGHGMDHSIKERIFDPFFTTKDPGEGTGMGLAVVHGTVSSHGGIIIVESAPGKGSTFTVFLPMAAEIPEAPETRKTKSVPTGTERILFVDDEAPIADMSEQVLRRFGYEVVTRTNSIEALEAFRAQPQRFDLVITDQTMPNMTGDALARQLLDIRPDIPIILCTGYSELVSEEKARATGIREYVMKPLVSQNLAETIRRVLDQDGGKS